MLYDCYALRNILMHCICSPLPQIGILLHCSSFAPCGCAPGSSDEHQAAADPQMQPTDLGQQCTSAPVDAPFPPIDNI